MDTKKFLACFLAAAMMCGALASCGDSDSDKGSSAETTTAEATTEEATEEETTTEASEEATDEPQAVAIDDIEFEDPVAAEAGDAYLAITDEQWWIQYWGDITTPLTYDAGVVHIDGNGDYTVSVTCDTNGFRYDTTNDVNDQYVPAGIAFAAVIIKDAETVLPDAVITVKDVRIDGESIGLIANGYTNTEEGSIRSNLFNEWVSDDNLPGDARVADGYLFNDFDNTSPSDINDGSYSATIVDTSKFSEWTTVEVDFTVSGL